MALTFSMIALVVAVVTLPTAFQQFWGGPKIVFRFSPLDRHSLRLTFSASNVRVEGRLLPFLRVRREPAAALHLIVSLQEHGTGKNVAIHRIASGDRSLEPNMTLERLLFGWHEEHGWLFGPDAESVPVGRYVLHCHAIDSSHPRGWFEGRNVTLERERGYWGQKVRVKRKSRASL